MRDKLRANLPSFLLATLFVGFFLFGWLLKATHERNSEALQLRVAWLGELTAVQQVMLDQVLRGERPDTTKCIVATKNIQNVGVEAAEEVVDLVQVCEGIAMQTAPLSPDASVALNNALANLIQAIRAENRGQSKRLQATTVVGSVLLMVVIAILFIVLTAWLRSRQQQREEEIASKKLMEEAEERDRLTEALKQSEERLATALYSIRDAVLATDDTGAVELMNPVAERLTGWSFDDAKGRKLDEVLQLVQEGNNRATGSLFDHATRGGTEPRRQVRVVAKDGTSIPVERTVAAMMGPRSFLGVVVGLRDISEERRAASDLEQVQRDFRQVIERSPDGVAIQQDGLLVYVNAALANLLGYRNRDSLLHYSLVNLVHPSQRAEVRVHLADPEMQTLPGMPRDVRFLKADGEVTVLELSPGVVVTFEGERSVLIAARDVTERQRMMQRMVQVDRLTSVGSLTGGIVNQINSPLAVATTGVSQALEELGSQAPGESRRMLVDAREALEQVGRMVRDLNSFSVTGTAGPRAVDLRRVMEACIRLTGAELRPRGTLRERYADVRPVLASEPHLRHLLVNLLVHAIHQLDERQRVRNELTVVVEPDGDRVKAIISDNGPGLHPEELAHIFDPVRNPQRMGLALCQGLASELQAGIQVDSQSGQGIRVVVDFPTAGFIPSPHLTPRSLFADPFSDPGKESVPTPAPASRSLPPISPPVSADPPTVFETLPLRVLLVDDDEKVANAIRRTLRGYDVSTCTSGRKAVELCAERTFDVVVCDLMMEDFSGMDVYEQLRQHHPELVDRIVFMTGGAYTPRSQQFLDTVENRRLLKPFTPEVIRQVLGQYQRRME